MENRSQKIYRDVISCYSEISGISKRRITGLTKVISYYRKGLAKALEGKYYIHFNNPDTLSNINAFAKVIKRFDIDERVPQIEEELRDVLKLFFRNKEWKKDEIVFEYLPKYIIVHGVKKNLRKICLDILQAEIGRRFRIQTEYGYMFGHGFFDKPFTFRSLVEWVYLNEKQSLQKG